MTSRFSQHYHKVKRVAGHVVRDFGMGLESMYSAVDEERA